MSFDDFPFSADPAPGAPAPASDGLPMAAMPPLPPALTMPPARRAEAPTSARARAGLGFVAVGIGAGVGAVLAGPLGALAGLTGVGAARNLYRSQNLASSDPTEKSDAARSLALGVIGVAITGYLGYKIYSSHKDDDS